MNELKQLEKKVNQLTILCFLLFLGLAYSFLKQEKQIIRTQGIIIEDEHGRDRILLGAPIPSSKNRVRTDNEKVWKYWGQYYESEFMDWYKDYDHNNYGMVILDSLGFDRVAIGNPVPDLSFGQRIGPLTGIAINDELGNERTGYGVLNVNGKNRVNIGLDNEDGTEGVVLALDEYGITGLKVMSEKGTIFLGKTDSLNPFVNNFPDFNGLLISDSLKRNKIITKDN